MPTSSRLVHLLSVAKSFPGTGSAPKIVFGPTTLSLPTDRRVAILGGRRAGKTTFLQILARKLAPDRGQLIAPLRFSPVVNSGGLFHPQLTALENIRFIARMSGICAERLTLSVDAFNANSISLDTPFKDHDSGRRRALEVAVAIVLPFDCYLFDDAAQLAPELLERSFDAAAQRCAGLIFTTATSRLAHRFADAILVIGDTTLHPFADIEEGIQFFERQQR
jgi:capsular polysaccharide transport system ATP-binding protein